MRIRGPWKRGAGLPRSVLECSPLLEHVPMELCTENVEADASPKN